MLIDLRTDGLNIYFLCPFLGSFCLIGGYIALDQSIFGNYSILKKELIAISQILVIIPYLFIKRRNNQKQLNNNILDNNQFEEEKDNIKIYQIIIIGLANFFDAFIFYLGDDLFENKIQLYFLCSDLLFLIIFQKFILEIRIYRHQTAAFILFFILDITYIIIVGLDEQIKYNFTQIIFIVLSSLLFTFEMTYEKKLISNGSNLFIYKLCILIGIFSFCLCLIVSIITTIIESNIYIEKKNKIYSFNYKYFFEEVSDHILVEIILILIYLILNCIQKLLEFLTIKNLSPNHVIITYVMAAIYDSISMKVKDIELSQLTLTFSFILYILLFFASFIFLEIIQLNFCGINKDITFKISLKHDVNRYMQSFSEDGDEDNIKENSMDEIESNKSIELNERNISAISSELDSYNDE